MQEKPTPAKTMFEKIWDAHVVRDVPGETPMLYIDRDLVYEIPSPPAFAGLRTAGLRVHRPDATITVLDHNVPTVPGRRNATANSAAGASLSRNPMAPPFRRSGAGPSG